VIPAHSDCDFRSKLIFLGTAPPAFPTPVS